VVVQERLPRRRGWLPWSQPLALHGRFGHVDAQLP
jgi:hypothetical protein